jgi:hypothetical protein
MFELKNLNRLLVAAAVSLALSACGGGSSGGGSSNGGGGNNTPPSSNAPPSDTPPNNDPGSGSGGDNGGPQDETPVAGQIAGVAAVGAPLVGTVTVKDALGVTKTVQIGNNGSYSVDVSDMTAPFVFRAAGKANGREYIVHSAASEADVDGTINITQLTDLVITNIAGQLASDYFEGGEFSSLSKEALDAETAALKEKLLPVLQALGVDASVDLLRTPFTPLASALDSALDILRVTVYPDELIATITNIVTQQEILDDISLTADQEVDADKFTETTGVSDIPTNIAAVRTALEGFSNLFASGLPSKASIKAKLSTNFRFEDRDGDAFAGEMSGDSGSVGMSFTDVDVKGFRMTEDGLFATVDFTAKDQNGVEMDRIRNFQLAQTSGGQWLLHGDQKAIEMTADVLVIRSTSLYPSEVTCTMTGIEFFMEDFDPTNNGATDVAYVRVYGPGMPEGGLRYDAPEMGGWWPIADESTNYYVMNNSCGGGPLTDTEIKKIPDNARYLVKAYDADDEFIRLPGGIHNPGASDHGAYLLTLDKRPPTLAEAQASTFPTITSPASALELSNYNGGDLTLEASGLNPSKYADFVVQIGNNMGPLAEVDEWLAPNEDGEISELVSLSEFSPVSVQWRSVRVGTRDEYRRTFMRVYN